MIFDRITDTSHCMFTTAMKLYRTSFPEHEQREALSQTNILNNPAYHFNLVYDKNCFVGLVLYWETVHFIYVEHFCILPELRNHRYGQKILDDLKNQEKTIILEIDPPVDEISIRRKGFYERCGFMENSYSHIHPPYHLKNHGHNLMVMSCPRQITPEEYHSFNEFLHQQVMNDGC